jgi:xylose isomerase
MLVMLKHGGLAPGGVNFDAKVRRESFEPIDLFHAHIGGMDAFARGLKIAAAIRADGVLATSSKSATLWDSGIGAEIESGKATSSRWRRTCSRRAVLFSLRTLDRSPQQRNNVEKPHGDQPFRVGILGGTAVVHVTRHFELAVVP